LLYRFRLEKAIYWLSPILAIFLLSILYFALIEPWWYLRRLAPAIAMEKMYRRVYRLGRPLAGERTKAETAHEFMHKLVERIDTLRLSKRSRFAKLFFAAEQDIELLTDLYQDTLFTHNAIQKKDVRKALHTWKHLRLRLWIARVFALSATQSKRIGAISNAKRRSF